MPSYTPEAPEVNKCEAFLIDHVLLIPCFDIGVGVAALVFGLVFALGEFLPSGSPTEETEVVSNKLSEEEKMPTLFRFNFLQSRLKQYETILSTSPKDPTALEGAGVTLAELGEYTRAASLLQDLAKNLFIMLCRKNLPSDPDVLRLLGEVKYELKDYEGSAAAYRLSAMASKDINFELLRGLTNALLAAKKPDEAVKVLRDSPERLNAEKSDIVKADNNMGTERQKVDPIQIQG
ncbi:hypothetical protein Ddye_012938 [Dipteronia dyeriana]|uniref:Tetratricopeptide repeat protein n=1 Tax=Dipteronia dyeriana TaxID=168575 RepID=A0AAE0CJ51_9ROSI|nr:hypothetical protein Ddye_012938 [Dipteronia dyeriana]